MKKLNLIIVLITILINFSAFTVKSQKIRITTAQEFIDKIKSNSIIILDSKKTILSNVGYTSNPNIEINTLHNVNDREIHIKNIQNVTITGEKFYCEHMSKEPELVCEATSGNVLVFDNCKNITIRNIKAGHDLAIENCFGGILKFENCSNIKIEKMVLCGKGTYGIIAENVKGLNCKQTIIKNCTSGIINFKKVENFVFNSCIFSRNKGFDMIILHNSYGNFTNTRIKENTTYNGYLFKLSESKIAIDVVMLNNNFFRAGICNNWDNYTQINYLDFNSNEIDGDINDKIHKKRIALRKDLIKKWKLESYSLYNESETRPPHKPLSLEFKNNGILAFTGEYSESFEGYSWYPIDNEHILISKKNNRSVYYMISKIHVNNTGISFYITVNNVVKFNLKPTSLLKPNRIFPSKTKQY